METTVEGKIRKQPKYWAISIAAIMATAFVLVQPAMQVSNAELSSENLPVGGYDNCLWRSPDPNAADDPLSPWLSSEDGPSDPITMNSVRFKDIVKSVHSEKEVFDCTLGQGNAPVIVDVTTYIEIYENITAREIIETSFLVTICLKDPDLAQLIDCESYIPDESIVPTGTGCEEQVLDSPQETNTINKGKLAKTIDAQKEIFICDFKPADTDVVKKVDIVIFAEVYEDLNTQTTIETQFHAARCVILVTDGPEEDAVEQDAKVEGCVFTENIPN